MGSMGFRDDPGCFHFADSRRGWIELHCRPSSSLHRGTGCRMFWFIWKFGWVVSLHFLNCRAFHCQLFKSCCQSGLRLKSATNYRLWRMPVSFVSNYCMYSSLVFINFIFNRNVTGHRDCLAIFWSLSCNSWLGISLLRPGRIGVHLVRPLDLPRLRFAARASSHPSGRTATPWKDDGRQRRKTRCMYKLEFVHWKSPNWNLRIFLEIAGSLEIYINFRPVLGSSFRAHVQQFRLVHVACRAANLYETHSSFQYRPSISLIPVFKLHLNSFDSIGICSELSPVSCSISVAMAIQHFVEQFDGLLPKQEVDFHNSCPQIIYSCRYG